MQRDEAIIQDILNAARLVLEFVKGFDKETFMLIHQQIGTSEA